MAADMFAVIYAFQVKPGQEPQFEQAWREMTLLIRTYENGWGSRLHRKEDGTYIAYAQWPDKETWETSGGNLPESAQAWRTQLREACDRIETLHEMQLLDDLLIHRTT